MQLENNFDFLKDIDNDLYEIIIDAQKLFLDKYFSQCVVQVRIFAERMARKIIILTPESTFDDVLNCLKDKIKTQEEKEFIEDLFFIKREGNKCAHGENCDFETALEVIKRAFEASINYVYAKTHDETVNKLLFDTSLLIFNKPAQNETLAQTYSKKVSELKEETKVEDKKEKINEKIKSAKKILKQKINKKNKLKPQKPKNKVSKTPQKKQKPNKKLKMIAFLILVFVSILFLLKMFLVF